MGFPWPPADIDGEPVIIFPAEDPAPADAETGDGGDDHTTAADIG